MFFNRSSTIVQENILSLELLSKDTRTNPEEIDYFVLKKNRRQNKKYTLLYKVKNLSKIAFKEVDIYTI